MVTVMKGGAEMKLSKRAGNYLTVRELVDEVGCDAVRYFFLMRRGDSHLVFDVDLAKSQTDENPVFYVQMAHARMSGIFRVAGRAPESGSADDVALAGLDAPREVDLMKEVAALPRAGTRAAPEREPHQITGVLGGPRRLRCVLQRGGLHPAPRPGRGRGRQRLSAWRAQEARGPRRGPTRGRAGRGRVIPLEGEILLRPGEP